MASLKWNDKECGWECTECGALYSEEEVARCFDYHSYQTKEEFVSGFCMDCGTKFDDCVR